MLLDLGIENRFSVGHAPHGRPQLQVHCIFQNVSLGASFDRLPHPSALGMHAEHEHRGLGQVFKNLPRRIQAIRLRQSAVHDHDLRPQFVRQPDSLFPVAGFADHHAYRVHLPTCAGTRAAPGRGHPPAIP